MCNTPEISIILPVYNGERFLRESLDSIISQSFQDWELIIVDDCSTDSTKDIIEDYSSHDDRIRIIHNERNMKLPESLNIGFKNAVGRYYTWTSDDNVYEKTALRKMYDYLETYKNTPMVVADMSIMDDGGVIKGKKVAYSQQGMAYENVVGACFLYRSTVRDCVGDYSKELFLVEDYDYWLRVIFSCGEIKNLKEVLYYYRSHTNSLTIQKKIQVKERLYYLRTYYFNDLLGLASGNEEIVFKLYCEMIEMGCLTEEQEMALKNSCSILASLVPYAADKPTIIYGAGNYGKATFNLVSNVVCFSDRNPELIGQEILGVRVLPIDKLRDKLEDYQLIVAIKHYNLYTVLKELKSIGVDSFCIVQSILSGRMRYDCFEESFSK